MTDYEKRFMKWLERAKVHECAFAKHPVDPWVEYCQICGVLREANDD